MGKPTNEEVKRSLETIKKYCQMTDNCEDCAIQSTCDDWSTAPDMWESTNYNIKGACRR